MTKTRDLLSVALPAILLTYAAAVIAQAPSPVTAPPNLSGVYQSIPASTTLPGGLRNTGSPAEIALLQAAIEQMKKVDLKLDPEKECAPIGPFRMMARDR